MHIILAQPRGFCAGVRRAIEGLHQAVERFPCRVSVYHEIVHNNRIVAEFRCRGVHFVESLDDVPAENVLMFSAHGISPDVLKKAMIRGLKIIDATCPLVNRVHQKVRKLASEGFKIIYIGHPDHDEVVGTIGQAPGQVTLISSETKIEELNFEADQKLAILMQTTLSVHETRKIVGKLQQRYPKILIPDSGDICYATQNRQEAVHQLAWEADVALVIGSSSSSNSQRLCEVATAQKKRAFLIDGPDKIDKKWFTGNETVLVSAGASAPEYLVEGCIRFLQQNFQATFEERIVCEEHLHFSAVLLPD